jgi:hypothetical protein
MTHYFGYEVESIVLVARLEKITNTDREKPSIFNSWRAF